MTAVAASRPQVSPQGTDNVREADGKPRS